MSKMLRTSRDFHRYLRERGIDPATIALPKLDNLHFPLRIPVHYADLINWQDANDPLLKIVLPSETENQVAPYEVADPIGDHNREAVPGLIHRYPDRCLLLLTTHCLIHCRFCFRREVVGKVRPVAFKAIKQYLQTHPEVHEVIFSGGDPGTFPAGFFQTVINTLKSLPHLQRWRIHTRVPVADPDTITPEWLEAFTALPGKKVVVIHINHPRELSAKTKILIDELLARKILVFSQSVLLKGVNDDAATLAELFTNLVATGVKPYYLHHLDQAPGTGHFRLSIEAGKQLYRSLRGHVSTICLPEYVLDLPGGLGKVPVFWLEQTQPGIYQTTTFEGHTASYQDPARL